MKLDRKGLLSQTFAWSSLLSSATYNVLAVEYPLQTQVFEHLVSSLWDVL